MVMKTLSFILLIQFFVTPLIWGQDMKADEKSRKEIYALIDDYSVARENKDTVLLNSILTEDIDQLVSSGEWRSGIRQAIEGMMLSSTSNPGSRRLIIDKIRFLDPKSGIVDAKYEIENPDGSLRKMWSTFIVVFRDDRWKIAGIRNMLPTDQKR